MKKINKLIIVLGILTAICGAISPFIAMSIGGHIGYYFILAIGILFGITILLMLLSMLLSKQWIIKLSVLPILFSLFIIVMILRSSGVSLFLQQAMGLISPDELITHDSESIFNIMQYMHLGILLTSMPMIIAAIIMFRKAKKRAHIDFKKYDDATGKITAIIDTRTTINRQRLYNIKIEIYYYLGEQYTVEKDFAIPMHMIHLLNVNSDISLKINPENKKEVYIVTNQGIL